MQAQEEKRQKQREAKSMYERSLKMKMDKENKELQEQLAFDLKILEQLVEESKNEAREEMQRKVTFWNVKIGLKFLKANYLVTGAN